MKLIYSPVLIEEFLDISDIWEFAMSQYYHEICKGYTFLGHALR